MGWILLRVKAGRESDLRPVVQSEAERASLGSIRATFVVPGRRGYLFLQLSPSKPASEARRALDAVRLVPGVREIVGHGEVPMIFAEDFAKAILFGTPCEFHKGDAVSIIAGPFEGYAGVIDELVPDRDLVRVLVRIFGKQAPIELEEWQIGKTEGA